MNRSDIRSRIRALTQNEQWDDLSCDVFIDGASVSIGLVLRHPVNQEAAPVSMNGGLLPPRFVEPERLIFEGVELTSMTPAQYYAAKMGNRGTAMRRPYWTILAGAVVLSRSFATPGALTYYAIPELLAPGGSENAITRTFPNLYVYGACMTAFAQMLDEERAQRMQDAFSTMAEQINEAARREAWPSGGGVTTGR